MNAQNDAEWDCLMRLDDVCRRLSAAATDLIAGDRDPGEVGERLDRLAESEIEVELREIADGLDPALHGAVMGLRGLAGQLEAAMDSARKCCVEDIDHGRGDLAAVVGPVCGLASAVACSAYLLPGFEEARWAARRTMIQQMLLERTSSGFLDDGVREGLISEIGNILRGID